MNVKVRKVLPGKKLYAILDGVIVRNEENYIYFACYDSFAQNYFITSKIYINILKTS